MLLLPPQRVVTELARPPRRGIHFTALVLPTMTALAVIARM